MNMQETIKLRRQLLANGWTPLPNLDKRCVLPDWPRVVVDEKTIDRWSRMRRYGATGLRLEDRLAVIDFDVNDEELMEKIANAVFELVPVLADPANKLLVRRGKGFKEAWFVRTEEVFSRLHTRRWVRLGETADDGTHSVEIFGGGSARQFGAIGAHTRADNGEITVEYQWVEGASPLDTRLDALPVLTKDQFAAIADNAEELMEAAGWTPVLRSTAGESASSHVYDLTEEMVFDMADGRSLSLEQLRAALAGEVGGLRCSASWLEGPTAVNTSRCLVSLTRAGAVAVWESAAGVTHIEASRAPKDFSSELNRAAEKIKALSLKEKSRVEAGDDCYTVARKLMDSYAFCRGEKLPVIPLVPGLVSSALTNFRISHLPYCDEVVGPRGGVSKINPVDVWLGDPGRVLVEGAQMRPDKPRPLFIDEDGAQWVNTYQPAMPEGDGGSAAGGLEFLEHMLPDAAERAWFAQWLAFKYRHPWIPGPAVLMVARQFGTGRGTLARFMEKLFGASYVKRLPFHMFAGKSYQSQYNDWEANALIAVIAESSDGGHQTKWEAKSNTYERLKDLVEPGSTRKMIIRKGERNYEAMSFTSYIIATNHVDALPIPVDDRRFAVLSNGERGTEAFWRRVNEWMEDEANVAAFARWLESVDLEGYSPFVAPPMTKAKETMADVNMSDLDRGLEAALESVRGEAFVPIQIINLMRQAQKRDGLDYPDKWVSVAKQLVQRRAYRVGVLRGQNWTPSFDGQRHPVYALSESAADRWTTADAEALRQEILRSGSVVPGDTNLLNAVFGGQKTPPSYAE